MIIIILIIMIIIIIMMFIIILAALLRDAEDGVAAGLHVPQGQLESGQDLSAIGIGTRRPLLPVASCCLTVWRICMSSNSVSSLLAP